MRIRIAGDHEAARVLRSYLAKAGYALTESKSADYTVFLEEHGSPQIVFDSVDSELESRILRHVRDLTVTPISIWTAGGIQSGREIRISFPPGDSRAVETGTLRAFLELIPVPQPIRGWRKKLAAWIAGAIVPLAITLIAVVWIVQLAALFLPPAFAQAQQSALSPPPEPKPISLEDREATKTLQIDAYKTVVRMRSAQLMKAQSEKEELQAQYELEKINAQIDRLTAEIRKRSGADERDWDLTPEFKWKRKSVPVVPIPAAAKPEGVN
jgi:hypothetical protein